VPAKGTKEFWPEPEFHLPPIGARVGQKKVEM
jgi:hypothetical protein